MPLEFIRESYPAPIGYVGEFYKARCCKCNVIYSSWFQVSLLLDEYIYIAKAINKALWKSKLLLSLAYNTDVAVSSKEEISLTGGLRNIGTMWCRNKPFGPQCLCQTWYQGKLIFSAYMWSIYLLSLSRSKSLNPICFNHHLASTTLALHACLL